MSLDLLLPLLAALIYALASIFLKRALKEGASTDQTFHFTNLCISLVFFPLFFFEKQSVNWNLIWQPIVVSLVFFLGNLTTFLAIKKGDISSVTPLMGTKVIFVAIAMVLLMKQVPSKGLWAAAILTSLGIFLMGFGTFARTSARPKNGQKGGLAAISIVLASAILFALQDVLLAQWSTGFGALTFMGLSMAGLSLWSLVMWLCQGRPSLDMPRSSLKFGLGGGGMIGIQAALMGVALSFSHNATKVNVVYASRGLWVLVVIAFWGSFFGNDEKKAAGSAFRWRVAGAILVTLAVIIAVLEKPV